MTKANTDKKPKFDLYDAVLEVINSNEYIYNENESGISAYMRNRWEAAANEAHEAHGVENATVGEMADMGQKGIDNPEGFLDDLRYVLKKLSKGIRLSGDGEWV